MYNYLICNNAKSIKCSLPVNVSHLIRKIFKGNSLHGDVIFSSNKLINKGFTYKYNVENSILDICSELK